MGNENPTSAQEDTLNLLVKETGISRRALIDIRAGRSRPHRDNRERLVAFFISLAAGIAVDSFSGGNEANGYASERDEPSTQARDSSQFFPLNGLEFHASQQFDEIPVRADGIV